MSKAKDYIKRLRQETCPSTYCPDFDKDECLDYIESIVDAFEEIKAGYLSVDNMKKGKTYNTFFHLSADGMGSYFLEANYHDTQHSTRKISKIKYLFLKEILETND